MDGQRAGEQRQDQVAALEAQVRELEHANQELMCRAAEAGELRSLLLSRDVEVHRLKSAVPVDAFRLARLESENSWLRVQLNATSTCRLGCATPSLSPPTS